MKKILNVCNWIVKNSVFFIFLFSLLSSLVCIATVGNVQIGVKGQILTIVFTPLILWVLYKYKKEWLKKTSLGVKLLIGFGLANAIMITTLVTFNTEPVSDSKVIWEIARSMANGEFDIHQISKNSYQYLYNWQIGMAFFESIFIKILGESFFVLKIVNLICINLTLWLTFVVTRQLVGVKPAIISFYLMSVFYPVLVSVGQLTNQNVVAVFVLLFIILVNRRKYLLAGLILPVLSFIRPLGIIMLIALACLWIFELISKKESFKRQVLNIVLFFVPYAGMTYAIDCFCISQKYADSKVSEAKIPYFKFHKGLGSFNAPFEDVERFDNDIEAFNNWEKKEVLNAYVHHPVNTIMNGFKKMMLYLGWFDWKFEMTYNQKEDNYSKGIISECVAFGWAEYIVLLVLGLLGYKKYYKIKNGADFIQIFFIGITFVYFFIEAWTSYRYESYPLIFVFAGLGFEKFRTFKLCRAKKAR